MTIIMTWQLRVKLDSIHNSFSFNFYSNLTGFPTTRFGRHLDKLDSRAGLTAEHLLREGERVDSERISKELPLHQFLTTLQKLNIFWRKHSMHPLLSRGNIFTYIQFSKYIFFSFVATFSCQFFATFFPTFLAIFSCQCFAIFSCNIFLLYFLAMCCLISCFIFLPEENILPFHPRSLFHWWPSFISYWCDEHFSHEHLQMFTPPSLPPAFLDFCLIFWIQSQMYIYCHMFLLELRQYCLFVCLLCELH